MSKQHLRALGTAAALLLLVASGGCMVGPDFTPPSPETPAHWEGPHPAGDPATFERWWTQLGDERLGSLVERGFQHNKDLRQAEARLRQAREAAVIAGAALLPQLGASGGAQRSDTGGARGADGDFDGERFGGGARTLYQAGFDASWELDIFGGNRRAAEAARADATASHEERRFVLITLAGDIAARYVTLRGLQEELAIARKNLAIQERNADIARRRHEAGFAAALDVANAESAVAATAAQIPLIEAAMARELHALSVLLGEPPRALAEELRHPAPIPPAMAEVPLGLPSELLRRRPDIRQAEAQVHAATARIGVATADLFPEFSLTAMLGVDGSDLDALGNWSNRFWTVGGSVATPIFQGGRIRANIRLQNAAQDESLARYEAVVLNALREVEDALVSLDAEAQRGRMLAAAVESNRRALELATQLYTEGVSEFLNVLTAEQQLFSAEVALTQSTRARALQVVELFKVLGGGWEGYEQRSLLQ